MSNGRGQGDRQASGRAQGAPSSKTIILPTGFLFIAAPDAAAASSAANEAGGKTLAPARDFSRSAAAPYIGDPEGTPIGIIQSSSGDPADYPSKDGDWASVRALPWAIQRRQPVQTSASSRVFHYDVRAPTAASTRRGISSSPPARAAVAGIQGLDNTPGAEADWILVVQVADLDATIAHGLHVKSQIACQPSLPERYASRFAIISDPDGGVIGLVQFVDDVNPATAAPGTTPNPQ